MEVTLGYLLEEILKPVLRRAMRLEDECAVDNAQFHGTALLQSEFVSKCLGESQGEAIALFLNSCSHGKPSYGIYNDSTVQRQATQEICLQEKGCKSSRRLTSIPSSRSSQ